MSCSMHVEQKPLLLLVIEYTHCWRRCASGSLHLFTLLSIVARQAILGQDTLWPHHFSKWPSFMRSLLHFLVLLLLLLLLLRLGLPSHCYCKATTRACPKQTGPSLQHLLVLLRLGLPSHCYCKSYNGGPSETDRPQSTTSPSIATTTAATETRTTIPLLLKKG